MKSVHIWDTPFGIMLDTQTDQRRSLTLSLGGFCSCTIFKNEYDTFMLRQEVLPKGKELHCHRQGQKRYFLDFI